MRVAASIVMAALLVSCANDDTANSTTSGPPPTYLGVDIVVQGVVDIGGGQVLGLTLDANSVWAVSFDNSTIAKVDPETNTVSDVVDIEGTAATALAIGTDVWVVGYGPVEGTNLYRIDAESATLTERYGVGELCCDLSLGGGSIWAVDPSGRLLEIDPSSGELLRALPITIDRNAHTNAVYSEGYVWVASDTTDLSRLDPATGAIDSFDVGGGVPFLSHDGLLWGAAPTEVWAVNVDGVVVERITLADSIEVLSLEFTGPGGLWVGIRHPGYVGAVLQIDRATGQVLQEFDDIEIPARMVVGFGSLWITDSGSSNLYRLGPLG